MESDFYFEFENKFRGDQDAISKALGIYDSLIHQTLNHVSNPKILDIGCGRGEFLEKWKKYIPNVLGIENDSRMVSVCESKGLNIIENNALEALQILPDNSISLITIFHMVEHLEYNQLFQILVECSRILQKNGVLIIETPSIDNLIVSTNSFYLDHSHKTHINAESFSFMIENNGFVKAKHYFLRGGPLQNTEHNKLTRLLNGVAQDLLFVATKSQFMADDLFNINNTWELQLNVGITTMKAAIEYDLANLKQYQLLNQKIFMQQRLLDKQGKLLNDLNQLIDKKGKLLNDLNQLIDKQGKLLNDLNQHLLNIQSNLKYFLQIMRLFSKCRRLFLKFAKSSIIFLIKIITKIFNFLLRFPILKTIFISNKIKKIIYILLDLFPNNLRLKIIKNIEKKIDKVSDIDLISSSNNKKLLLHYENSYAAKKLFKKLINF